MNAPATALPLPAPRIRWGWLVALAVAFAIAAFLAGLITGGSLAPSSSPAGAAAHTHVTVRTGPVVDRITGTGPDLLEMAARSHAVDVPVTGTGPDLAQVAVYGGHGGVRRSDAPVTGTGPDLAFVGASGTGIHA
jgi:hypothetical protein